jgi:N6-adenosine-specific RNA methylase IME4
MELTDEMLARLPRSLQIEIEENACRKDLTQSELAAQQKRILDELRNHKTPGKRTDLDDETSVKGLTEVRATAVVGRIFGESHMQVEKRLAVCAAAEAEPERFGKLVEDMDRSGLVNGVFRRLKIARQAEAIRAEPPPLPDGKWRVVVIDFPWPYEVRCEDPSHRAVHPYPTMTMAQICAKAEEIGSRLCDDAIVWLWCNNFHLLRRAAPALDALGVSERTIITWVKDRFGCGDWLRGQTEPCVMAVRGKPTVTLTNESTVLFAPMRGHSVKPPEFYALVERLCPAPAYLDVFSRYRHNDKWTCWGDEAPATILESEALCRSDP